LRKSLESVDSLEQLPRVGPAVKHHLARNIGLSQSYAKPDLHLVKYMTANGGATWTACAKSDVADAANVKQSAQRRNAAAVNARVQRFVARIAAHFEEPIGVVDFCLFCWLSHDGKRNDLCCNGKLRLR